MLESAKFENEVRQFCIKEFNVGFECRKVKIGKVEKSFDLVSDNGKYIGDAKYYKMRNGGKIPHGKISAITDYVWTLEKTSAKHKFLVFGLDKRVPKEWLKRFGKLTKVRFYFFHKTLEKLN